MVRRCEWVARGRNAQCAGLLTYRVLGSESEHQSEGLVEVEGIVVENFDIEVPCLEVVGRYEGDASWQALSHLHDRRSGISSGCS